MNGKQLLYKFSDPDDGSILKSNMLDDFEDLDKVEWFARIKITKDLKSEELQDIINWFNWFKLRNIPCILTKTQYYYAVYKEPFYLTPQEIKQIEEKLGEQNEIKRKAKA